MVSRLVSFISPANVVLFALPDRVLACRYFSLINAGRRDILDIPLDLSRSPARVVRDVRAAFKPSADDTWSVGLPLTLFTLVNLNLPAAAADNLDQAVRYAMMRHVPYDISQAHVAYHARHEGGVEIQAAIAQRQALREYLDGISEAGIEVSSVFPTLAFWAAHGRDGVYFSGGAREAELLLVRQGRIALQLSSRLGPGVGDAFFEQAASLLENQAGPLGRIHLFEPDLSAAKLSTILPLPESDMERIELKTARLPRDLLSTPHQINLVSEQVRRRKRYALGVQAAAFAFVLLALMLLPLGHLLGKSRQLGELERRIEQIRPQADHLSRLHAQGDETIQSLRDAALYYSSRSSAAELLLETTEILPDATWLSSFHFVGGQIRIQGTAVSATSVIEALENSPLFREVRLDSPVTKTGARDNFQISAQVEG